MMIIISKNMPKIKMRSKIERKVKLSKNEQFYNVHCITENKIINNNNNDKYFNKLPLVISIFTITPD